MSGGDPVSGGDVWSPQQRQRFLRQAAAAIAEHGWAVQGVAPDGPDDVPFAYTLGMTPAGLPELAISGLTFDLMRALLNAVAVRHLAGDGYEPGQTVEPFDDEAGQVQVPLRVIAAPRAEVGVARALFGPAVRAVQLVWPDRFGAWPGTGRWRPQAVSQELFGDPWWGPDA
jgi:hypothetical protein